MVRLFPLRYAAVAAVCLASASIAAGQAKVAVINLQRAVVETADIKKAQAELEAKFKPRQAEMEKLQREIAAIQQQLQTMQGKLTPQAEQDLQIQGQRKQRDYQRLGEDLQAEVDRERNEILARAGQRMTETVKKLAESKGYDVIVDSTATVFFKPAFDITQEAITAYDQAFPVK